MNLIAQHCSNLNKVGINGLMLSWTVGGCPSPNQQLVQQFSTQPPPTIQQALTNVAQNQYGKDALPEVLKAWSDFSTAFTEYPFHISFVYRGPAQLGPSNLLYPVPTGHRASMVGFHFDDIETWRAVYPAEVLASQFEKVAAGWQPGLTALQKAFKKTSNPNH